MHFLSSAFTIYSLATLATAFTLNTEDAQTHLGPSLDSTTPTIDPCTLAESPSVNASIQLSSWLECQINGFYPYPANGDWPSIHASAFSKDILFTFNATHYNHAGSLALYHSFNATLGRTFAPFKHGFIHTLGVPSASGDRGGFVYMIGWAGGVHRLAKRELWFTNAAFAVVRDVGGRREIAEFRESSNIPNSAPLPAENEWTCGFAERGEL